MVKLLICFGLAIAMSAQTTRPPDNPQNIKHGGGTKTVGYCLVWDAFGLVSQATCGAGGGETNAGANLGSGALIYTGKSGVNLQFRSFTVGSNKLSVTQNTNDIAFDILPSNLLLSALGGSLNLSQLAQGGATTGQLLQWNGTAWVAASVSGGGGPANTDALAEGSTNLYYTQARARAALSVAGILSYNNGTGVFTCSNCADITSSYSNPSWISALAWSKLTGVPSYQLTSEKGAANGYASLNASTRVPPGQLGGGTPDTTNFLRGDGTWTNPAGSVNLLLAGTSIGTRPGLNIISGSGVTIAAVDDSGNNRVNITTTADTSVMLSRATGQGGTDNTCIPASASGTVFTCSMAGSALTAYTNGMRVMFRPDVTLSGTPTLNISTLGAKYIFAFDRTNPASGTGGGSFLIVYDENLKQTTVNTSGTAVTGTAGAAFTSDMVGTQIKIGSTFYTVSAFSSATSITLGSSAGTQTGVTLAAGGWVFPATGGASAPTMFSSFTTVDDSTASDYNTALTRSVIDGFPVFTSSLTGGASQGRVFSLGSTFDKKMSMFVEFGAPGDGHAGVMMTDGTRNMVCGYRYNNAAGTAGIAGLEFFAYNMANATTYTGAISPASQMTNFQYRGRVLLTPLYMRVIRDATNLTCQTSPDGVIWMNFATQTTAAFISAVGGTGPTSAGIWIREGGTAASTRVYWKGYQ